MSKEAGKLDPMQFTVQYELLRSQAVGRVGNLPSANSAGQARGIGLALLLSEGLPGWIRTVAEVLRASPAVTSRNGTDTLSHDDRRPFSIAPGWMSSVQLHQITKILASLVLSTRSLAR